MILFMIPQLAMTQLQTKHQWATLSKKQVNIKTMEQSFRSFNIIKALLKLMKQLWIIDATSTI